MGLIQGQWAWILLALGIQALAAGSGATEVEVPIQANVSPRVVVLWTMERSGSTYLSRMLGQHPCIIDMQEFLSPWCRNKEHYDVHERLGLNCQGALGDPLDFVLDSQELMCSDALHEDWYDANKCKGRCIITLKLFNFWEHKQLLLADMVGHKDVVTLVVKRDVEPQFCSLMHAHEKGDWGHTPSEHKAKKKPCSEYQEENPKQFAKLQREHEEWFKLASQYLVNRTHMHVPFESYADPSVFGKTYASIIKFLGLGDISPLTLTHEPEQ